MAAVTSDTQLSITTPFQGQTGSGKAHTLARQFTSLQTWENCVSGNAAQCPAFPVTSGNLVTDNRIEVGLAYQDAGGGLAGLTIDGSTTDIAHTITLTAASGHRHLGNGSQGAYLQPIVAPTVVIKDLNVRVEWLVMRGGNGGTTEGAVRVDVTDSGYNGPIEIANNMLLNLGTSGIVVGATESQNVVLDVTNNVSAPNNTPYQGIRLAPFGNTFNPGSDVYVANNTAFGAAASNGIVSLAADNTAVTLLNNVAWGFGTCFSVASPAAESNYNLSSDGSAPGPSSLLNVPASGAGGINFTDTAARNYHLLANSAAIETGISLSTLFERDIDNQKRPGGAQWDIGADEFGAPTAVKLMSFVAVPGDGAVTLEWRTASELDNVGFHLWRGPSAQGPWTRLTSAIIPGAGSSPVGHAYSWLDAGLANGVLYFYRLEDVDTSSVSTFHGPVSAVPGGAAPPPPEGGGGSGGGSGGTTTSTCPAWVLAAHGSPLPAGSSCSRHGDPDAVSFDVVSRDARGATLELRTGGFWALPRGSRRHGARFRARLRHAERAHGSRSSAPPRARRRGGREEGPPRLRRTFRALRLPRPAPLRYRPAEAAVSSDGTVRPARRARPLPRDSPAATCPSTSRGSPAPSSRARPRARSWR